MRRSSLVAGALALGLALALGRPALAQETPSPEPLPAAQETSPPVPEASPVDAPPAPPAQAPAVTLHGFVQANGAARLTGSRPPGGTGDFLLGEERLRLELSGEAPEAGTGFRTKLDFFHDPLASRFDLELREGYVDLTTGPVDMRLGRQILTWGVGDLLFINDVFPKDFGAFFSGRPLEYLKVGVDGLKVDVSSPVLSAEMVAIPFFTPDRLPAPDHFVLGDPFPGVAVRRHQRPELTLRNMELALRLYTRVADVDLSAYAYKGYWRSPAMALDPAVPEVVSFYPPLSAYGLSAQLAGLGGVFSLEYGYYDSRADRAGTDPTIPNSQSRFLVGYQGQGWEDFTYGLQYYGELMHHPDEYLANLPPGFPAQSRFRQLVTLRLTQLLAYQTVKLSLFTFFSPSDGDAMVIPEVNYKLSDHMAVTVGVNVFAGGSLTPFGGLNANSNIYTVWRYEF